MLVEFVPVEVGLREVVPVKVVVLVDFDDPFHQRVETAMVEIIDEGPRIEIAVDELFPQ